MKQQQTKTKKGKNKEAAQNQSDFSFIYCYGQDATGGLSPAESFEELDPEGASGQSIAL